MGQRRRVGHGMGVAGAVELSDDTRTEVALGHRAIDRRPAGCDGSHKNSGRPCRGPDAAVRMAHAPVARSDQRSVKDPYILVVEDNVELRDALQELLCLEGFQVCTASNGREALDVLKAAGVPSLVLLDLMMPVMDGWQLLEELRRAPGGALAAVPVVVISGVAEVPGRRATPDELGCTVIAKPVDVDRLVALARKHVAS